MSSTTLEPTWADISSKPGAAVTPDVDFDINKLKRMFDDARTLLADSRVDAELSRDYYDGPGQLTAEMRAVLKKRKQPEIYENLIRGAVDGIVGVIDSNKVDPRAYPREPSDEDAADVASDTLRYTAEQAHFNVIKADALENGLVEGCYAAIIEGGPDQDVTITQIRWDEFFYDPRSRLHNFHDSRYLGIAKWMYADHLSQVFPGKAADFDAFQAGGDASGLAPGGSDLTWGDKPDDATPWVDSKLRRLMVVEIYHQDNGGWMRSVFTALGILEHGTSPYLDDKGRPRCAIEAGSAYISRNNTRYGIVRDMRPMQDEVNSRRSKMLHELNVRQVQQTDESAPPVDVNVVRAEAARPDGVIPMGWSIVERRDVVEGQAQLLAEAKGAIDRLGPNLALSGRDAATQSGRQDQIRQDAGIRQLQRVLGRFADWELRIYKATWAVQRQFWTEPKWIRITGDEMAAKYVQVNVIVQPGVQATDPQTGQPATDQQGNPIWAQPPVIKNELAKMDVDIIIDTVPDTASLQQEVWQELTRLLAAAPQYAQQVPFKLAIELSPLPRKKQLLDMLDAAQQQNQGQIQAAEQLKASQAMAEQLKTESEAFKNFAMGKGEMVTAIAAAVAAHMQIDQATAAEQALQAGLPVPQGMPGAAGATPPPAMPAPAPAAGQ